MLSDPREKPVSDCQIPGLYKDQDMVVAARVHMPCYNIRKSLLQYKRRVKAAIEHTKVFSSSFSLEKQLPYYLTSLSNICIVFANEGSFKMCSG